MALNGIKHVYKIQCINLQIPSLIHKLYAIAIWIRTFHQHLIIDMCTVHRLQFYIAFLLKPLFINIALIYKGI